MSTREVMEAFSLTVFVIFITWMPYVNADGVISFVTQHVSIEEKQYEEAIFQLKRESGSSEIVFFYCKILNSTGPVDFVSSSATGQFGTGATSSVCKFTVKEDNTPEPNITYSVGISIQSGVATIGTPNTASLTILANDDPFGSIGFEFANQISRVQEPLEGQQSTASFNIIRRKGTIGTSSVFWQASNGLLANIQDISPTSGYITFNDGESSKFLNISIQSDQIPENEEQYIIDLINVTGGASINSTLRRAFVAIQANDPPVSFFQSTQSVSEAQTLIVTVRRGIGESGLIGDTAIQTTVNYNTVDGSARSGIDYQASSGSLVFNSGDTSKTFSIPILKDPLPEIAENFTVVLSNPSPGSVLFSPYVLTVTIGKNDDPHGVISFRDNNQTLVLDEDSASSGVIQVNRTRGTFGTVTVLWRIVASARSPSVTPNQVLNATEGYLTFGPGVSTQQISLLVKPDSTPEEATEFYIHLINVTGGARLDPVTPQATLIVKDSDNAYGIVVLSNVSEHRIVLSSSPRRILVLVKRSGGAMASVRVNYTAVYLLTGSSMPSSGVQLNYPGYITLGTGSYNATIEIQISENSFLKKGAAFLVRLTSVQLEKNTIVIPSTPVIGNPQAAYVNITSELANGEIAFFNNPLSINVDEPRKGEIYNLSLLLMRDGVSGPATVSWRVTPVTSSLVIADASPWSGVVYFRSGADRANLTITIHPDDIPELDETFIVELTNVTERNERLRTGGTRATVKINRNDIPGGTFEFNQTGRIILQENDVRTVDVVRLGGALTTQRVQVTIINGQNDFISSQNVFTFAPNKRQDTFYIFTNDDNIPETNENFTMVLTSIDGTVLGGRTTLEITILQSDDANGVFSFQNISSNLMKYADETKNSLHTVSFIIERNRGTFSSVSVYWNVTSLTGSHAASDLQYLNGVVRFAEGQTTRPLNISIKSDQLPEGEERFHIRLTNITGGGRLADPLLATLIINPNDVPIHFLSPLHVSIEEGQTANFTISLNRNLSQAITVHFSTVDVTASASSGDYIAARNTAVIFVPGETRKKINISTIDDSIPEIAEDFIIRLNASTGDTVLIPPTEARVTIKANDAPYGVFDFSQASLQKVASEGETVSLQILRSRGTFGNVSVSWQVLSSLQKPVTDNTEFVRGKGSVYFGEGSSSAGLSVVVRKDGAPELNETFYVRIVNVTGNFSYPNGGYIGNQTEATIVVLPSDDPYGVIEFAPSSLQVSVAEDYKPGFINATHANLTVERKKGTVGTLKIAWQLFKASDVPTGEIWDFIFFGQQGSAVIESAGRSLTGTPALNFNSSNASFVTISAKYQPSTAQIQSGFSISLWMKPVTAQGVLVSKWSSSTNKLAFQISLNYFGGNNQIVFQANSDKYNISVPAAVNILDGNWHSLAFTISTTTLLMYVNGTLIGESKSLKTAVATGPGHIYLGCNSPSSQHYIGALQDVRMYSTVLIPAVVTEILTNRMVITPINGYLNYGPGVASQHISILTMDNSVPEPETVYAVKLINIKGDGQLSSSGVSSRVTILKSDNANGVFGFESSNCRSSDNENKTNISFAVRRTVGSFGNVRLNWEIRQSTSKILASNDFVAAAGSVIFSQGETSKLIVIRPIDDNIPELNENFVLRLTSADSTDGTVSSTSTSGASIKPSAKSCNVTILANDYPNGIFQITQNRPNGTGIVQALTAPQNINVMEETNRVTLYIVRAQGVQGIVRCEWKTNQFTARGNVDFRDGVGTVILQPGQNVSKITVDIIDNKTPELEKLFNVQLYNPTGGAVLGAAQYINVTILPSDDAYGVFIFANSSSNVRVLESSGAIATLTVARIGGQLGEVNVTWRLDHGSSDFNLQNGSVVFATGQATQVISIQVTDDKVPELMEKFTVQLISATKGRLAAQNTTATIHVSANDDPYGVFELSATPVRVQEQNITISLKITRGGGDLGMVRVYYQTYVPASSPMGVMYATPNEDFIPVSSAVDFARNQRHASINITIIGDLNPEPDEYFMVNLTNVILVNGSEIVPNTPRLGPSKTATIIIVANDDANGILQLSAAAVTVKEEMSGYFLNVTRVAGNFGQVSVRFSIVSSVAVLGSDFQVSNYVITLGNREDFAVVPVKIVNDDLPEFNESFAIRLEKSSLSGGAKLGSPWECVVTILENDYPYGLLGFSRGSSSLTVAEPGSGFTVVRLTVLRNRGTTGTVQVEWNATLGNQLASDDVTPTSGNVRFLSGDNKQEIEISIRADNVPEDNEAIQVNLVSISNGKAVIDASSSRAVVNIPANDDPYGVVQFNQLSMSIAERDADYDVHIPIVRTRGLFGTIRIYYSTKDAASAANQATSGGDYKAVVNQAVTIGPGNAIGNASVKILKDNVAELDEHFLVEINSAEVLGLPAGSNSIRVGLPRVINMTIAANDQPYGLFGIYFKNAGIVGPTYAIIEPESGQTSITFEVKRRQGHLGSVAVSWRVAGGSTVNTSSDVSGVSGGRISFSDGEFSKEFIIAVNSDDLPESDERLIIELYGAQGGAVIDASRQKVNLVIKANDGVGGRIGFSPGSRSKTVNEGQTVPFEVYRTAPAAGNVTMNWTIVGVNASRDFAKSAGKLFLREGITSTHLTITSLNDSIPESHESFTIQLLEPVTNGISSTGAAVLVPGDSTATVTIGASDEPHGIVEFAKRPQPIRVREDVGTIDLRIVRNMGHIGNIEVHYQLRGIKINKTTTDGTYGEDFNSTSNNTVLIPDGSDSATIRVYIINDNIPEQTEAFYVNITSVRLIGGKNVSAPPKIGSLALMQILIEANDGTQGELAFAPEFGKITVREDIGSFNITVMRYKGSFGDVYAFYYLNRLTASTNDFDIPGGVMAGGPAKISFANGERERNITVFIRNDNITEADEQFELGLTIQNAVNNGGVKIGSLDKSLVTIAANDDANGVFRFASRSVTQHITEPVAAAGSNNTATFFVERLTGFYGVVKVRWMLTGLSNTSDVTPISGLLSFASNVKEQYFQIRAVADDIPELQKIYNVEISIMSGGARIASPSVATLVVAANDDPHGLLSIRALPSLASSVNIEESTQFIETVVRREGGSLGQISVQYQTRPRSALSLAGQNVSFGFDQILSTTSAQSFHSFKAYGIQYLLLASSHAKQPVGSRVISSFATEPYESTLFRWQGSFVPLITLKTDGAVKWKSFDQQNTTYIVAINHGANGRYEAVSQVMKLHKNNTVELVQNIETKGASDSAFFRSDGTLYMIITNMKDNSGNTVQQSQLLRWQGLKFALESASLQTKGASSIAVCSINGVIHVAIANNYDSASSTYTTASQVYSWSDVNKRFSLVQSIQTHGATDVECSMIGAEHYLFFTNSKASSRLYRYKTTSPAGFVEVQEISLLNAKSGKFLKWNFEDYLAVAGNSSMLYKWSNVSQRLINITSIPVTKSSSIQPFTVTDDIAGHIQYLSIAESSLSSSYLIRLAMLSDIADFVPRRGKLTFYEGQKSIKLGFTLLVDTRPEMDESFSVELLTPEGGAALASSPNLAINILSNDNAYGRLAFADRSLRINFTEQLWDSVLRIDIVREFGSFGQVSLNWNISSVDGEAVIDLSPTSGQVNLNQGVSSAAIFITVRADGVAELNEEFIVSLTSVSIAGAASSNRGPTINHLKSTSMVTILANNEPYGLVGWKNRYEITTEEKEVNSSALLVLSRSHGTLGDIVIAYETQQAVNVSKSERRAIPGVDYFAKKSSVLMRKGEREAVVYIKVRHDNNTAVNEIFNVKITDVSLVSGTSVPNSPRINQSKRLTEVVITETVLSRGTVQFENSSIRRVSENIGILTLALRRSNGSEGSVAVHFVVNAKNASSKDFGPVNGLVTFSHDVTRANLNITIVNDNIAELDEALLVKLIKPSGGVKLGPRDEVEVIITENDYPYGLISFNIASRLINDVIEGQSVRLIVDRAQGRYRDVSVDWSCGSAAQSDLNPWHGTLTFSENVTQASISIQTINDTTPEVTELFTCVLTNPRNGAVISSHNNSTITILPNDKPYGIISISSSSKQLTVAEPMPGYNGIFSVSVLRSVGFDGQVSAHWSLSSVAGLDNTNSTFNSTSGIVVFASGVSSQKIYLQVLNDAMPEESKKYQLYLERATGGAELDIQENTKSNITVAASDNPYGTVQFSRPLKFNVSENVGSFNLTVTRTDGRIGQLIISYTTSNTSAQPDLDFTPAAGTLTFNPGEGVKSIQFNIIDDAIPELSEVITVNLTSVRIVTSKELNYGTVNGIQVDTPPKIGTDSTAEVTINANDKPYGEIQFLVGQQLVHESDGTLRIPVNRTGGTFGTSTISFTYSDGSAKNPADYTIAGSSLTFVPGERQKFISVTIIDDKVSEFQESFRLDLTSISGPATFGSIRSMNITIETSDNPYGLFGIFNTTLSVSVENPNATKLLSFPLSRKDGYLGRSEVSWRVLRNIASASLVTEDISPGSGTIVFEPNQRGPKMINITILTAGGPEEPEEQFTLHVYSATGGAALDHAYTNVSITVLKKGHPNGLFRIAGAVLPSQTIAEPEDGTTSVEIPVQREYGNTGMVKVHWSVRSSTGSVSHDFAPFNTSLIFLTGETTKSIKLAVRADNIPELDEVFEVILTSADNGADINLARNKINFTISANDYPHGLFKLDQTSKRFEFISSTLERRLHFSVNRTQGTVGVVNVNIAIKYSESGSSNSHMVTFADGQSAVSTVYNISKESFTSFGANFTVRLQGVTMSGSGSSMGPAIDASSSPLVIVIPEGAANSIVEFDSSTRYPTASQSYQVSDLRISRRGLFGSISVQWRSGYPPASFTIGTIAPSQGTVSFVQGERTKSVSFQVQVPPVLPNRLIYAVYLSSVSPAQGQPAGSKFGPANTAVVDPHGVVEISPNNMNVTVIEGSKAAISVRRLLSTVGAIRINYVTQKYIGSEAATEGVDFTPVSSSFEMIEGQTTAVINVDTIEDSSKQAERDEFFFVVLTSVQSTTRLSASSPRLSSTNSRSTVRIRDNDSPFGVISFKTQIVRTQESAGHVMLRLQRTGGVFSKVAVLIRSIGGGESWQNAVINSLPAASPVKIALNARSQAASAISPNKDYEPINKEIVFEELNAIPVGGQIKAVNLSIMVDAIAEPAEQIILLLTNVTGGAILPGSSSSLKDYSVVTIDGNGLWNGKIGFTSRNAEINEDGPAQVTLPLQRNGGTSQRTEVNWQVWSTAANIAQQFVISTGSVFFEAGNATSSITINIKKDLQPEFATWFLVNLTATSSGAIIANSEPGLFSVCNVTMLESDYPAGRIGFNDRYRFPVVTLNDVIKDIRVRRYDGTLKDVTVLFQTTALVSPVYDGDIVLTPARENQDFQPVAGMLSFPKGSTEAIINIKLTPGTASSGAYPKVFNITLMSPSNGAILYDMYKTDQVIISQDSNTATFLRLRSSALKTPLSDREIENILTEMLQLVKKPPLSDGNQNLVMKTIRLITAYKSSLPAGQRALTNSSKATLLDVYDSLLLPTRTDTRGKSSWALLLDEIAYNFLEDMSCPFTFTGSKSNFALTSKRDFGSQLNGVKFTSGRNADFFRYPVNMFSSSGSPPCTDIHFIDYGNQQFFSSGKPVLNNKVMSSKIKSGLSSGMKVVYRVHTSNSRVTQNDASCVIWQHASAGSKGDWSTNNCKIKGQTTTYVECECRHLSEYAVLASSDNRTGYEIYFFVSCYFVIGACFLALMAHHICSYETTFTVKLLMNMIFAIMMTNILYAVAAHISPDIVKKTTECGALALAIHYFFLVQFTSMFTQACNLWRILIMNDEHTERKFSHFFVLTWGLPVLIIVGYILITYAVYRWPFSTMYGDVLGNGDMCFITNGFAALGSVIIPVILFVLAVVIVFVQSFQVKPQWECYDDVYRGRYNSKELFHFIAIFALLWVTWLFAGLHLAFGSLWMIITFTVLNFILGLYILVVFAILRNDLRFWFHGKFVFRATSSNLFSDHNYIHAPKSLHHSERNLIDTQSNRSNMMNEWEDVELPPTLSRMDIPDQTRIIDFPDFGRGRANESYDIDSDEFDDLIFALKTGVQLTPTLPEEQELEEKAPSPRPVSADQPQIRRIKIADTHL